MLLWVSQFLMIGSDIERLRKKTERETKTVEKLVLSILLIIIENNRQRKSFEDHNYGVQERETIVNLDITPCFCEKEYSTCNF